MIRDTQFISQYYPKKYFARLYARIRIRVFGSRFDDILAALPETPGTIVDIGCGYGLFVLYVQSKRPHTSFIGIDTNRRRINAASQAVAGLPQVSFFAHDALTFSYPVGSTVVMTDMLHHVPFTLHEKLFAHIRECIGQNGSVCIADVGDKPKYKVQFSYWSDVAMYPRSVRCQFRTREQFAELFEKTGFSIQREIRNEDKGLFSTVIYLLRPGNVA